MIYPTIADAMQTAPQMGAKIKETTRRNPFQRGSGLPIGSVIISIPVRTAKLEAAMALH